MKIIFGREQAEELRKRYTIFELETFEVEGKMLEAFCVVSMGEMPVDDLPSLERVTTMHQALVDELKKENYDFIEQALPHLFGKFNGEMDSFYDELHKRIMKKKADTIAIKIE